MIPLHLTVKNFLSYRTASLDFTGLHTACICGANGAGKSSLLEAITWVIWGKSRVGSESEVIHKGCDDVRVDFIFEIHRSVYRIIRTSQRSGANSLEVQIRVNEQYKVLTGKGKKDTQSLIVEHLRLDYDTFINSAYLRQGKADEFMLKKAAERKQILADLLKLDRYEELANKSKDTANMFKLKAEALADQLQVYQGDLSKIDSLKEEQRILEEIVRGLQEEQESAQKELELLRIANSQRETWQDQLNWQVKRGEEIVKDLAENQLDLTRHNQQLRELEELINQRELIMKFYQEYQDLQKIIVAEEEKFDLYQQTEQERQKIQEQLVKEQQRIQLLIGEKEVQIRGIIQQEIDLNKIIETADQVQAELTQLNQYKWELSRYDELQQQVSPLLQSKIDLQSRIDRLYHREIAHLEELNNLEVSLEKQGKQGTYYRSELANLESKLEELEKKKVYLERVEKKGLKQRDLQERLRESIVNYERSLVEVNQKLELLQNPDANCPLCDRPLGEHDWDLVVAKTHQERTNIDHQLSLLREEKLVCDRRRQELLNEYNQLKKDLLNYDNLREQKGQLVSKLDNLQTINDRLQEIAIEKAHLTNRINNGDYAKDLITELQELEDYITSLNYDEKNHALLRNNVDRYRGSEIKQARIKDAQNRSQNLLGQKTQLQTESHQLQAELANLEVNSPLSKSLSEINQKLTDIGYNHHTYQSLLIKSRETQSSQLKYQQLQQAEESYPLLNSRIQTLTNQRQEKLDQQIQITTTIQEITDKITTLPNYQPQINILQQDILQRRQKLDQEIANQGKIAQQFNQLLTIKEQLAEQEEQLKHYSQQYRIYDELNKAFGKKGIQTLIIENILPQLETDANQILARLTNNQFHLQFLTQKLKRSDAKARKQTLKNVKMIDTLEIMINDANGTRPYESYSGGEAFRINFSIRLALAKLLSQRSGTPLRMLIVDEGFGTQDQEGCNRLIAAINAIAADFSCILTVTHMPQFKEAFQTRIEVTKTNNGSQLTVIT